MKPIQKVMLIVWIFMGGCLFISGIAISIMSVQHNLAPTNGVFLAVSGLVCLFGGVWLLKRRGKGILGSRDNTKR